MEKLASKQESDKLSNAQVSTEVFCSEKSASIHENLRNNFRECWFFQKGAAFVSSAYPECNVAER